MVLLAGILFGVSTWKPSPYELPHPVAPHQKQTAETKTIVDKPMDQQPWTLFLFLISIRKERLQYISLPPHLDVGQTICEEDKNNIP